MTENDTQASETESLAESGIHREATLDFSDLSSSLTVGDVQDEAAAVEEENLATESPLDRYVRQHRVEVEKVKAGFGQDIDALVEKERGLMSEESEVPDEALSESEVISEADNKSEKQEKTGLAAVGLTAAAFDAAEMKANDEPEELTESEGAEKSEENSVSSNESEESPLTESSEEIETVDGEILDAPTAGNRVIFPLPLAADAFEEKTSEQPDQKASSEAADDSKFDTVVLAPVDADEVLPEDEEKAADAAPVSAESRTEKQKRSRKPIIIGVAAVALLAAGGGAFALIQGNQQRQARVEKQEKASTAAVDKFTKAYDAFYTDSSHNELKNVHFDMLSALKKDLDAIPGNTSSLGNYQTDYNNLSADITATQKLNAIFKTPVIVDGKLVSSAVVKADAKVPSVSSTNTTRNSVFEKATALANAQLEAATKASQAAASSAAVAQSEAAQASESAATSSSSSTTAAGSAATGAQNPSGATPNNANSRVPVQNVNPNDAAFAWGAGVLDRVIATCQSRGYISGSNYILQAVAIGSNGDGWYNLYRPDGTYLVSIDCKTGFFAGNGGKQPGALPGF